MVLNSLLFDLSMLLNLYSLSDYCSKKVILPICNLRLPAVETKEKNLSFTIESFVTRCELLLLQAPIFALRYHDFESSVDAKFN